MKKVRTTEACGGKFYSGEDGGLLIFWPDRVEVKWNKIAPIAAAEGTGNRKAKKTIPTGNRTPPELDLHFRIALMMRGMIDDYGEPLPQYPTPEQLEEFMKRPWAKYAWGMLYAMINSDFEDLQRFTDATRLAAKNPERAGIYHEVEKALHTAATEAGKPPTQKAVFEAWKSGKSANQLGGKTDLRDELGRMGFAWLPAGKRGKAAIDTGRRKRVG